MPLMVCVDCEKQHSDAFMLLMAFGGVEPVVLFLMGSGLLAIVGLNAAGNAKWNREEFPKLYAHWDATFLCTRCENRFVP
jgi:hypothetical protein